MTDMTRKEALELLIDSTPYGAEDLTHHAVDAIIRAFTMGQQTVADWIDVNERLPEVRERPYPVLALCVKRYGPGNYSGEPIRGVYQDWVLRQWPKNYLYWAQISPLPEAVKPMAEGGER